MGNVTYKNQFNRDNYDQILLMIPKGNKDIWKAEANRRNMSLNAFVQEAVSHYLSQNCEIFPMDKFNTITYGNIIALCKRRNMSINDLMRELSISEYNMKELQVNGITEDYILCEISEYFNVSVQELTFGTIFDELR